jgi:hypothetical protein
MRRHCKDRFVGFDPAEWREAIMKDVRAAQLDARFELLAQRIFQYIQTNRVSKDPTEADKILASVRELTRVYLTAPEGKGSEAVEQAYLARFLQNKAEGQE